MNRPSFRVTLLLLLVLSITIWNALRLWTALAWRAALTEFGGAGIATVTLLSGAVWVLAGILALWGISARKKAAWGGLIFLAFAYSLWYWGARLLWQASRPNEPFAVVLNIFLLAFVIFATKSLSREAYERNIENPKTE